ncbi:MAG: glucose/sorbosone dehydrogenase [Chlorobi bacterium OLB5]|nr:MAG: glucose/sorbosone dehydrogenase [Chlorobi bacterium OLB5]
MNKNLKLLLILLFFAAAKVYPQVNFVNAFPNLSFSLPLFLTHSGDGTNRIFVVQQRGLIRVFPNDSMTTNVQTFLDVTNLVNQSGNERGLLGLAFHPNYSSNRYFFIYYTRSSDGALRISRFTTQSGNPNKADSLSELNMLTIPHPTYTNHNGGCLMFGGEGNLYIGTGDGGSGGDPNNNAQNLNSLLGKMLRIDINTPSGGNNYSIPPTNPYAGGGGAPEIFATGLRNPWRFSRDAVTGTIYCGDVGQDAWEEIDTISVGKNYGWRCYEGNAPYNTSGCGPIGNYTFPIAVYQNVGSDISVTGGYVYRGARVPWLVGRYIYADYGSRKVWKLLLSGGVVSDNSIIGVAPTGIPSFGVDQNNELYIVGGNGTIYKLQDAVVSVNGNNNQLPAGFSLEQNYPNPFNPVTKIYYNVGDAAIINITVYDVAGREVSMLVNETKQPGRYAAEFSAAGLPSGVYFYKMTVNGSQSDEKKMVLVK